MRPSQNEHVSICLQSIDVQKSSILLIFCAADVLGVGSENGNRPPTIPRNDVTQPSLETVWKLKLSPV